MFFLKKQPGVYVQYKIGVIHPVCVKHVKCGYLDDIFLRPSYCKEENKLALNSLIHRLPGKLSLQLK